MPRRPRLCKAARRSAFTLVELLVVVAVISLLASLLLASLRAAGENARTVLCASNQRQIGTATQLYATERSLWLPIASGDGHYGCALAWRQDLGSLGGVE